ncbi:DUF1835 domain-containing protein [Acidaminobacter hydrogenoformans]|uniref:DUF1835 domain-containing protein n=1 Tax=Acidaminobacter hydrogenoformans DSM 2784 TaxID=1120920 RepID=A0A1G5RW90_9FIRM|nr:DUF1835 domain-containing protein [Acidaminobacter hydrogenoformans]SCZ77711.1 Protein of unknown function [Acidaminobacter hydrogenoformans DSM 2784]
MQIHITFSEPAAASLRQALLPSKCDKILSLTEDFSVGPITGLDTIQGYMDRREWMSAYYGRIYEDFDELDYEEQMVKFHEKLYFIPEDTTVIFWHGMNVNDQVALRYVASILSRENVALYEVDVSAIETRDARRGKYIPSALSQLDPLWLTLLLEQKVPMTDQRLVDLMLDWSRLVETSSVIRFLNEGEIIEAQEDYFDHLISSAIDHKTVKLTDVLRRVLEKSEYPVTESYAMYRILHLQQTQPIRIQGDTSCADLSGIKLKLTGSSQRR